MRLGCLKIESEIGKLACQPKLRSSASGFANRLRPKADFGGQEAAPDIGNAEVLSAEAVSFASPAVVHFPGDLEDAKLNKLGKLPRCCSTMSAFGWRTDTAGGNLSQSDPLYGQATIQGAKSIFRLENGSQRFIFAVTDWHDSWRCVSPLAK